MYVKSSLLGLKLQVRDCIVELNLSQRPANFLIYPNALVALVMEMLQIVLERVWFGFPIVARDGHSAPSIGFLRISNKEFFSIGLVTKMHAQVQYPFRL